MLTKPYFVYIMTSRENGPLYIGVTGNLGKRIWEHREGKLKGYTRRYALKKLIYYEPFEDVHEAIACEKRLKRRCRAWKDDLIKQFNPTWRDLYEDIAMG